MFVAALLLVIWRFSTSISPAQVDLPINSNLITTQQRPVQAYYQIIAQGAQEGWTFDLHRRAGEAAFVIGDVDTAVAHWQAALLLEPNNAELLRQLAQTTLELQRWTPAADSLRNLLTVQPNSAWAHYELGLILAPRSPAEAADHLQQVMSIETYAEVVETLLPALDESTGDAESAFRVGAIMTEFQLWAQAERAFNYVTEMSPDNAEALAYIGLAREMQGKSGESWIQSAIAAAPMNAPVRYVEGVYLRQNREYAKAVEAFTAALVIDPLNPAYYVELGNTYRDAGDLVSAYNALRQAVLIADDDPQFQTLLDQFYASYGAALRAAGVDVADSAETDPTLQAQLGWTLYQLGAVDEAVENLDAALLIDPANPDALLYKARIALDQGDSETAKTLLQQVAASSSSQLAPEAQELLQNLP